MTTELTPINPNEEQAYQDLKHVLVSKQDVLMQLGQMQAFNFIGKLVTVTELKILQKVKDSKEYKGLTYQAENGELVTVTTWDDCCEHILGTDRRNIDNRLVNLKHFGEEFFEAAQRMQLTYKDLREIRQLPASEQAKIIESEAVQTEDKDTVRELLDEIKALYNKEVETVKEHLADKDKMLEVVSHTRDSYEEDIVRLKKQLEGRFKAEPWKQDTSDFLHELMSQQAIILRALVSLHQLRDQFVQADDLTQEARQAIGGSYFNVAEGLAQQFASFWYDTSEIISGYADLSTSPLESLEQLAINFEPSRIFPSPLLEQEQV